MFLYHGSAHLKPESLRRLHGKNSLDDEIINFAMERLVDKFRDVHFFNPLNLHTYAVQRSADHVKIIPKLLQGVFNYALVLFPWYRKDTHWTLHALINFAGKPILLLSMDSAAGMEDLGAVGTKLRIFLNENDRGIDCLNLPQHVFNVPVQGDGYTCGDHVIRNAKLMCLALALVEDIPTQKAFLQCLQRAFTMLASRYPLDAQAQRTNMRKDILRLIKEEQQQQAE